MVRSTACFMVASVMAVPAWIIDVKSLPHSMQVTWVAVVLGVALLGGLFWGKDGE